MELLSHNASSPDPLHQEVVYKRPLAYQKMENLIKEMQDPEHGVPVRSQKVFLTSIPAAFAGYDIIEWLMERLSIEDSGEAIHFANLLCQHGYFFPVGENKSLSVKDDSSLYRFQTPYYWPSQVPCLDSVDYAIYLAKRSLRNKQKHGLDDYEVDALNNLRKTLTQKWDFITMQADEQVRLSKERKKVDKLVTDSQERAFWRVLRPPPGYTSCVETPPMHMADFHTNEGVKQIRRTNLIEDLRAEVDLLKISCLRSRTKVSQALESLASHSDSYHEHDAFLVPRQPSNPWVSDDPCYWIINAPLVDLPTERRVKKWGISMEDLVFDPTGLREFTTYLKKEYCHENIRFWSAVRDLRFGPISQLRMKANEIYNEFLSPGAPCEINIDMRTMDAVQKEMNYLTPSRFTFDPAANHVYAMLLKKDCYPRFIRSEHYKHLLANALQPNTKKRFFNFSAPTKKKSSGTNAIIFPVGNQSATAGVGEVLKATDEVILITTGNRPRDLSTSRFSDVDKLSAVSDIPYRGDIIPDIRTDNSSTVRKALSQGSVDDVCPWESIERLPEKEIKLSSSLASKLEITTLPQVAGGGIGKGKAAVIAITPKLTASTPALAIHSCSPPQSALKTNKAPVNNIAPDYEVPTCSSGAASRLSEKPKQEPEPLQKPISTPEVVQEVSKPSQTVSSTSKRSTTDLTKQESVLSNASSSSKKSVPGIVETEKNKSFESQSESIVSPSQSLRTVGSDQNQNVEESASSIVGNSRKGSLSKVLETEGLTDKEKDAKRKQKEGIVEVCPWDHENSAVLAKMPSQSLVQEPDIIISAPFENLLLNFDSTEMGRKQKVQHLRRPTQH